MALYVFDLILFLGILFLLYCLWNFARELKPRSTRLVAPSRWPTWAPFTQYPSLDLDARMHSSQGRRLWTSRIAIIQDLPALRENSTNMSSK